MCRVLKTMVDGVLASMSSMYSNFGMGRSARFLDEDAHEAAVWGGGKATCACDSAARTTFTRTREFLVCDTCGCCVSGIQESSIKESRGKNMSSADLTTDRSSTPLVVLTPGISNAKSCFGCKLGTAKHGHVLRSYSQFFRRLLTFSDEQHEESYLSTTEKWIHQCKSVSLELDVMRQICADSSASSTLPRSSQSTLLQISQTIKLFLAQNPHARTEKPQSADACYRHAVLTRAAALLCKLVNSSPTRSAAAKTLFAIGNQLNTLVTRLQSFGTKAVVLERFLRNKRQRIATLAPTMQKAFEVHAPTCKQTISEEFLRCVQNGSGLCAEIADLLSNIAAPIAQMEQTIARVCDDDVADFDISMKTRFHHSKPQYRDALSYCCSSKHCHVLMGIGFCTSTTDIAIDELEASSPSAQNVVVSRWLPPRLVVRPPTRDVDSLFTVDLRLLGAIHLLTTPSSFLRAQDRDALLREHAQETFWHSNFVKFRIQTIVSVMTVLLKTREFALQDAELELSIKAAAITTGFWHRNLKAAFETPIGNGFRQFNEILMAGFDEFGHSRGNSETDAIVILRSIQYGALHKCNALHTSQPMKVQLSCGRSALVDVPCMPPSVPTRSLNRMNEAVAYYLKSHRQSSKSRINAHEMVIHREFTLEPFAALLDALGSRMLGNSTFHAYETVAAFGRAASSEPSTHPPTLVPRKLESVAFNLTPNAVGVGGKNAADTLRRVRSCTARLDAALPGCWQEAGVHASRLSPVHDAATLAVGLVVTLDGKNYPEAPESIPVNEGDEIAYRSPSDPLQHRIARPPNSAHTQQHARLDEAMKLESKLAMLVHGARVDEFCTIGMPCSHAMGANEIQAYVKTTSVLEVAEFATAAQIVKELMAPACMRAMVVCLDTLICRVITACTCTSCHVADVYHEGEARIACIERFETDATRTRARILNEQYFQIGADGGDGGDGGDDDWLASPSKRSEAQKTAFATSKVVEAISTVLTTIVGPGWAMSLQTGVESLAEVDVARQVFTPLHVKWTEFLCSIPCGARALEPPSDYAKLIEELNRVEHHRETLVDRAQQRDDQKELLFWENLVAMCTPLRKLYSKVSSCIQRNTRRAIQAESRVVAASRADAAPDTSVYAALDAQLASRSLAQWSALCAERENTEVREARRIETAVFKHEARPASDAMLGYFVHSTRGVLHHILYDQGHARATFQRCFEIVYYDGKKAPTDKKDIVDRMFQDLQITMLNLSYKKASYASVGALHRNRVMVEFLCAAALEGGGTTGEKSAAMAILRSGFCFVTGTMGLYKSSSALRDAVRRSTDRYGGSDDARVAAAYTLDEAEESMRRRARNMKQDELHWSRRRHQVVGNDAPSGECAAQVSEEADDGPATDPSFAFEFDDVSGFDEAGVLVQSGADRRRANRKVDVDHSADALFGRAGTDGRLDEAELEELRGVLFGGAR